MKEYTIAKKTSPGWEGVSPLSLDTFKWVDNTYRPKTLAWIAHDNKSILVKFEVFESQVTVRHTKMNDPVCEDSCVEFFFRPIKDERYLNLEVNAAGVLLLGLGTCRHDRVRPEAEPGIFDIRASISDPSQFSGPSWTIEYKIPFSFLEEQYGGFSPADGFFGNLYKCGDKTVYSHYGMWNPIRLDKADFHRPEFFGRFYTEI